ncbi:protein NUCLEAR FUSION DEFECTIVE 6, mitochondrial-like isoform X1 [Rosa rugosa]|uniref:protein NUCLEAR FUSION DEFECTIVE 6, mitochondrial-like isoform X1 n=1 Tax=Rosa rugosa TaxID=74645 RepID=UPI002B406031|nr:protein NUCLEAR FUSION DEFECTIVE 6, mitochondrial-like isoform X1 [Rosa rugosa]
MASFAARSMLRSAAARTTLGSRVASAARPKPSAAPFTIPKQNKNPIFRSPVELSCCVETLLPYHTATASALLTSMLSVSQRSYGWTPEGQDKTR